MKIIIILSFSLLLLAGISEAQWSYNGTHIYNSNTGNVGIGSSSPATLFEVAKNMTEPAITVHNLGGIGGATYSMVDNASGANWKFKATNAGGFKIRDQAYGLDVFVIEPNSSANALYINGVGNVGIGIATPAAKIDIAGGNNWDLINGEGDFRLGNSLYRIKMGIALAGGGAGAAGIMQYGQTGGYNVLKLGAQGNYLLFINGETQGVGIGTDSPMATLDIQGTLRVSDGNQGAGLVLTSDGDGIASWANDNKHYVGESYGGGIVFYIYDNGYHGLIAATSDQNAGIVWFNGNYRYTGTTGNGLGAGSMNTAIIVAAQIADNQTGNFAAKVCADYSDTAGGITYGDWYLPSSYELNLLYLQRAMVGGFTTNNYWSSSEINGSSAYAQSFADNSNPFNNFKGDQRYVRAIRAF